MSSQQQGGGGQSDPGATHILWVIALVFIVGVGTWWLFGDQLKVAFYYIRLLELKSISFVLHLLPFQSYFSETIGEVDGLLLVLQQIEPQMLTPAAAKILSEGTGKLLRWPIVVGLVALGWYGGLYSIKSRYVKKYDMKSLAKQEQGNWPQIRPVLKQDLINQDLDKGPWAMAMTPTYFAKKYRLLDIVFERDPSGFGADTYFANVIESKAERVFTQQLGRRFTQPHTMPLHKQALFAAFIARACRDTKTGQKFLQDISNSAAGSGTPDFSKARALLKKHGDQPLIQDLCSRHAFESTLLAAALDLARNDGVLPMSDLMWLKPLDRKLWYILSSVGRQTPFVEAAGIFAHWKAEKMCRRPLSVPMVAEAIKALDIAVKEMIYVPDEKEKQST